MKSQEPQRLDFVVINCLSLKVEYKLYSMGAYVTSINGVSERVIAPGKEGYLWYVYDREKDSWTAGLTSADNYLLHDGDVAMWKYTHWKF